MAHFCPECSQSGYCGGDIDDIFGLDPAAEQACTHCSELPKKDYDDFYDDLEEPWF